MFSKKFHGSPSGNRLNEIHNGLKLMMDTDDNLAHLSENRLVFYSSPGQLQELACVVATASICYRLIKNRPPNVCCYLQLRLKNVVCSDLEFTRLPSVLQQRISECFEKVSSSLMKWFGFHHVHVFHFYRVKNLAGVLDFVDLISWQANGTIDYVQTAKELIKSNKLREEEKYRFACIYCFVDDVKKLWPVETKNDHLLIQYWYFLMSGELRTNMMYGGSNCIEAGLLMYGIDYRAVGTKSAFEYLWQFLTDEERVELLSKKYLGEFVISGLCKLDGNELERVMISNAWRIFTSMLLYCKDFVIQLWNHVKNMITNDGFYEVICRSLYLPTVNSNERLAFAFEIWTSAPDDLKNHLLDNCLSDVLQSWRYCISFKDKNTIDDVRFLIELLSSTSDANITEKFWKKYWRDICCKISPEHWQRIIKLCLRSDDEVASFKKTHLSGYTQVGDCCRRMLFDGKFGELNEFLRFTCNGPKLVLHDIEATFNSKNCLKDFAIFSPNVEKVNAFETFLGELCPNTYELNELKRRLIFGKVPMEYFRSCIEKGKVGGLRCFVDNVLSSVPDLRLAKSRFLQFTCNALNFKFKSENDWNSFLKWCLDNDDAAVQNFKLSLPIDKIFNNMFRKCTHSTENVCFESMKFLEWVFPTREAAQNFKLGKLQTYDDSWQIRSVLESKNEELIDKVLMWFFNDDEKQVKDFKVVLRRHICYKLQKQKRITQMCRAKLRKRERQHEMKSCNVSSSYCAKLRKRMKPPTNDANCSRIGSKRENRK